MEPSVEDAPPLCPPRTIDIIDLEQQLAYFADMFAQNDSEVSLFKSFIENFIVFLGEGSAVGGSFFSDVLLSGHRSSPSELDIESGDLLAANHAKYSDEPSVGSASSKSIVDHQKTSTFPKPSIHPSSVAPGWTLDTT